MEIYFEIHDFASLFMKTTIFKPPPQQRKNAPDGWNRTGAKRKEPTRKASSPTEALSLILNNNATCQHSDVGVESSLCGGSLTPKHYEMLIHFFD